MVWQITTVSFAVACSFFASAAGGAETIKSKTVENIIQVGAADVLIQECRDSITRFAQKKNSKAVFCADGVFVCRRAITLAKALKTDDPEVIKFFKGEVYKQIKDVIPLLEEMVAICK